MSKITYALAKPPASEHGLVVRLLRACILCGVWFLVALAGLVVWTRLSA